MLDFAWSEIALIGVVALVLIGPKDMPIAIKAVSAMVKKARRMAAEFQTHVDDMVKDTELQDVRNSIREIRTMDIRGAISRAVDSDGSIRSALKDPLRTPPPALPETAVEALPEHTIGDPAHAFDAPAFDAPAVIPPAFIPPTEAVTHVAASVPAFIPPAITPPAFIPPETAAHPAGPV